MKKLIYGFLAVMILLSSCTDFETYDSIPMGPGPDMTITLNATADSSFTVTFAPTAEASYYSYFIETSDEVKEYNAANILKCTYKDKGETNTVNYTDNKSYAYKMVTMPNTVYQVYAVAASKNGIIGKIAQLTITTTDGINPSPLTFKANTSSVVVTFSEKIKRGTGKVFATAYAINALSETPVEVEMPDSNIAIKGTDVTFTTPEVAAGAYVCITWEEGAFTDLKGNPSRAYDTKGYDVVTNKFKGINYRMETETISLVAAVKDKTYFNDWKKLEMLFFSSTEIVSLGKNSKIQLRYNEEGKSTLIDLKFRQDFGFIDDTTLVVMLPEEPQYNASIDVIIAAKSFQDKYGNETEGVNLTGKYVRFLESTGIEGVYHASATSYFANRGSFDWDIMVEKDANNPKKVWISNLEPYFFSGGVNAPGGNHFYGILNENETQIILPKNQLMGYANVVLFGFTGGDPDADGVTYPADIIINIQANGWLNMPNAWGAFDDGFYNLFYGGITFIKTSNSVPATASLKTSWHKIDAQPFQLKSQK